MLRFLRWFTLPLLRQASIPGDAGQPSPIFAPRRPHEGKEHHHGSGRFDHACDVCEKISNHLGTPY
jgi:hypothetical protein